MVQTSCQPKPYGFLRFFFHQGALLPTGHLIIPLNHCRGQHHKRVWDAVDSRHLPCHLLPSQSRSWTLMLLHWDWTNSHGQPVYWRAFLQVRSPLLLEIHNLVQPMCRSDMCFHRVTEETRTAGRLSVTLGRTEASTSICFPHLVLLLPWSALGRR